MNKPVANGPLLNSVNEWRWILLLLLSVVCINFAVATRTPTVWVDEAPYTDPAANLYFGKGFTSTMWAQDVHAFWAGNVPLYQFFLFVAFKLFGFGLFQARAVNLVLLTIASGLIWPALRWSKIVPTPGGRLLCLGLILSGSVSTLTFRTIRPDTTMFFVCALVFFCSQLPLRLLHRCCLVALAGTLLIFAGVPMLPYSGLLLLLGLCLLGRNEIFLLISNALGLVMGAVLLLLFYYHFGSARAFIAIILPFTALGNSPGKLHTKIFGEGVDNDNLFSCFFGNPVSFTDPKTLFDYGAFLLFILFLATAFSVWTTASPEQRKRILFVIAVTLVIPPAMHMASHYHSMYRWMTYVPLTIAVPWILAVKPNLNRPHPSPLLAFGIVSLALLLGIPARTLNIIPQWSERSHEPVQRAAAKLVQPDDVVVCSLKAWFATRPHAQTVYCCDLPARGGLNLTVGFPTNRISLLCLLPKDYTNTISYVGGHWQRIPDQDIPDASALYKSRYPVEFYRRLP